MQQIVKNATNAVDRTIIIEAVDTAGDAVDVSGATLKIGSGPVTEVSLSGATIEQTGGAAHAVTISKAQSDLFAVGEHGYIRIPGASGALESVFPFLVTETQMASAPPTVTDIVLAEVQALDAFAAGSTTMTINGQDFIIMRDPTSGYITSITAA